MAIGNVVIYLVGLPWLAAVAGFTTVEETFRAGLYNYIPGDIFKLVLAAGLFPVAWWVVGRRPGER
jgi:biotin transport system substrate-specific component